MSDYKIHDGTLYDFTAGAYCGVLVKKRVMQKLAALQAKHLDEVKRILSDGADDGEVFPSMWTLHYPDGVQTNVQFIERGADLKKRIRNATTSHQPRPHSVVFIADGMDDAQRMADARYEELNLSGGQE